MKHPVADRSGRRVVYESWNYEINLWEAGCSGLDGATARGAAAPRAVTRTSDLWNLLPAGLARRPRASPTCPRNRVDHELWIANRDGADARQLTHLDRGAVKDTDAGRPMAAAWSTWRAEQPRSTSQ